MQNMQNTQLGQQGYNQATALAAPQSRLSAYCTSMASHVGDTASLQETLQRILMHLSGNSRQSTGLAGATNGGPAPVTGLLEDAEKWLTMASGNVHDARDIASQIELLVAK